MITAKKASRKEKSDILNLYERAFPIEERLPVWLLRLALIKKSVKLTAYFCGEKFCGFTYAVAYKNTLFVLYLAVEEGFRGKGAGSEILKILKQQNKTIVLNIEPVFSKAENFGQRVKRKRFYEKNGFFDTGKTLSFGEESYLIMATDKRFSQKEYIKTMKILSFGSFNGEIK